jgi:hypothetical protein
VQVIQQPSFNRIDVSLKRQPCGLISNAGLALVGHCTKRLGDKSQIERKSPVFIGGIAHCDIVKIHRGLLEQGKNDFDATEALRGSHTPTHED